MTPPWTPSGYELPALSLVVPRAPIRPAGQVGYVATCPACHARCEWTSYSFPAGKPPASHCPCITDPTIEETAA